MAQEVIALADQKVRERIRAMKTEVKEDAKILRSLKLCLKTKDPHPKRAAMMHDNGLTPGAKNDTIQFSIWLRKGGATARLIAYGRLRGGKQHTVSNPEQYEPFVEKILSE